MKVARGDRVGGGVKMGRRWGVWWEIRVGWVGVGGRVGVGAEMGVWVGGQVEDKGVKFYSDSATRSGLTLGATTSHIDRIK